MVNMHIYTSLNMGIFNRDKAIEEADAALKLTREQRIENFAELLNNILNNAESNVFYLTSTSKIHFLFL